MKPNANILAGDTLKRICSLCGVDRTPLGGGLSQINDRRGEGVGLFGQCCSLAVLTAIRDSPRAYGKLSRAEARTFILTRAKQIANLLYE